MTDGEEKELDSEILNHVLGSLQSRLFRGGTVVLGG